MWGRLDLALKVRLPHPGLQHGHHGNLTIKDQMTSDFAFHLSEWVLISAAVKQHMGSGGCAGVPQAHPNS